MSRTALALLATVAGACAPPGPTSDQIARAKDAIIGGVVSDAQDDSTIAIPLFAGGQFVGACSGVLVAANLVLTARHCVSDTEEAPIACDADGTPLGGGIVFADRAPGDLGVVTGATIKLELDTSGVKIFTPPSDTLCNSDLSLLLLDRPIASMPIAQLRLGGPPVAGEQVRAVGWGASNNSTAIGRRRRDGVAILNVGPMEYTDQLGGIGEHEFEVGESICAGDSGGPAYAETTRAVVGVVSRGGNGKVVDPSKDPQYASCVDGGGFVARNLYTRVDGFRGLLDEAFAAAGTEPWLEGGPDPRKAKAGEACASNDACRSALCLEPGAAGYCSQVCDDTPGACPESMECATGGDARICRLRSHGCATAPGARGATPAWLALLAAAGAWRARRRRRA